MGVESYSDGCTRRIIPQMQNLLGIEILRRFVFDPIHCIAVKDQSGSVGIRFDIKNGTIRDSPRPQ